MTLNSIYTCVLFLCVKISSLLYVGFHVLQQSVPRPRTPYTACGHPSTPGLIHAVGPLHSDPLLSTSIDGLASHLGSVCFLHEFTYLLLWFHLFFSVPCWVTNCRDGPLSLFWVLAKCQSKCWAKMDTLLPWYPLPVYFSASVLFSLALVIPQARLLSVHRNLLHPFWMLTVLLRLLLCPASDNPFYPDLLHFIGLFDISGKERERVKKTNEVKEEKCIF